jgi:hypothetical protein
MEVCAWQTNKKERAAHLYLLTSIGFQAKAMQRNL